MYVGGEEEVGVIGGVWKNLRGWGGESWLRLVKKIYTGLLNEKP